VLCEDGVFCWLQELGEEGSVVRGWGFLLVARVGRGRGRCVRVGFLLVARVGREEEGARRKGDIYGKRNPFNHY
jgi:hypothetical protein